MRRGTQYLSVQNRVLLKTIEEREAQIAASAEEYRVKKEQTRRMYTYVAKEVEQPVEKRLEEIMKYRQVIKLLDEEYELLKEQMEQAKEEKR